MSDAVPVLERPEQMPKLAKIAILGTRVAGEAEAGSSRSTCQYG
jgi:hypothetical protein